jgi:hypothetical protein
MRCTLRELGAGLFCILLLTNGTIAMGDQALPTLPTDMELVAGGLCTGVIHGWHSNLLPKYRGPLYAWATVDDPAAPNVWKRSGLFFRREADGEWTQIGATPESPYIWHADPDGRFWMVAPSGYDHAEVFHMERPLDFGSFRKRYDGSCGYEGASVSREGNLETSRCAGVAQWEAGYALKELTLKPTARPPTFCWSPTQRIGADANCAACSPAMPPGTPGTRRPAPFSPPP